MVNPRRDGSWAGWIGASLVVVAVVAPIVCHEIGFGESPEEVEHRNAQNHQCSTPDCMICEHNRQWLLENPGRQLGDMLYASRGSGWLIVDPPEGSDGETLDGGAPPLRLPIGHDTSPPTPVNSRSKVAAEQSQPDSVTEPPSFLDDTLGDDCSNPLQQLSSGPDHSQTRTH